MSEEDFQRAKVDVSFREQYVSSFSLNGIFNYVGRVLYNPLQKFQENDRKLLIETLKGSNDSQLNKSIIVVYPHAFEFPRSEEEFLSFLFDHEARHAWQFHFSFRDSTPLLRDILFITAYTRLRYKGNNKFSRRLKRVSDFLFGDSEIDALTYQLFLASIGSREISQDVLKTFRRELLLYHVGCEVRQGKLSLERIFDLMDEIEQKEN